MRSETNGLTAPTTTSPVGSEICNARVFTRTQTEKKEEKKPTQKKSCLLRAGPFIGAQLSVSSLRYHDCVGQEPVAGAHSSMDEFWESICRSDRATDLLRAGWNPVFVRHHPDGSLLQNQDSQC